MDVSSLPVSTLKGVGPRLKEKLEGFGLSTVQDVLFHLPFRYQDRTQLTRIGVLRPGSEALLAGTIDLTDTVFRGRRSLMCRVSDGSGHITLRFFHFTAAQRDKLARGRQIRCFGEARLGAAGLEMVHPEYEVYDGDSAPTPETHLTPFYPATEGVHQLSLRRVIGQALDTRLADLHEWLPAEILSDLKLPTLQQALAYVHRPPPDARPDILEQGRHPAQQRLVFEELLAHHLSLKHRRAQMTRQRASVIETPGKLAAALRTQLPFTLTAAQQRVIAEIVRDLAKAHPMQRLLQGDVGSGKTLVAAVAALHAIEAGLQVAVMAPTELLAEQHWRNFNEWLTPLSIETAWMSGKLNAKTRAAMLRMLSTGQAALAVGTHALFQGDVTFKNLGLVIVDEQHRFGVHQRLLLREKGNKDGRQPHQLTMTATPIPRTLAQALYADLDVSVIDELPPGRTPVETVVLPDARRAEVVARVHASCRDGRQVYWVCPLIEESETLDLQTAIDTEAALRTALPEISIRLVHGRMKAQEKEQAMAAFKSGAVQLLVATTVIEVGVDVPNASLMIVEHAERLGLAQLHQLRGRVGRGAARSSCVLMYHGQLSENAHARLSVLRASNDGFEIARKDLEMRGPGEVLGTRQTGVGEFHIADILRDQALLPKIERTAELLLAEHPASVMPLIRRWLGGREQYAEV